MWISMLILCFLSGFFYSNAQPKPNINICANNYNFSHGNSINLVNPSYPYKDLYLRFDCWCYIYSNSKTAFTVEFIESEFARYNFYSYAYIYLKRFAKEEKRICLTSSNPPASMILNAAPVNNIIIRFTRDKTTLEKGGHFRIHVRADPQNAALTVQCNQKSEPALKPNDKLVSTTTTTTKPTATTTTTTSPTAKTSPAVTSNAANMLSSPPSLATSTYSSSFDDEQSSESLDDGMKASENDCHDCQNAYSKKEHLTHENAGVHTTISIILACTGVVGLISILFLAGFFIMKKMKERKKGSCDTEQSRSVIYSRDKPFQMNKFENEYDESY